MVVVDPDDARCARPDKRPPRTKIGSKAETNAVRPRGRRAANVVPSVPSLLATSAIDGTSRRWHDHQPVHVERILSGRLPSHAAPATGDNG
jgi:hypothetical protein